MVFIPSGNKDVRAKIRIKSKKAFTLQSKNNKAIGQCTDAPTGYA
jgi:hypothetical protein